MSNMSTRSRQGKLSQAGKEKHQGRPKSPRRPFAVDNDLDRKVKSYQGMAAAGPDKQEQRGFFVNLNIEEELDDVDQAEKGKMGNIMMKAVEAAVNAAIPAIIQAVKEVCLTAVKEEMNPHLLRLQYKADELEQNARRENLRISGIPESEGETRETEDQLANKVCEVAAKCGVNLEAREISSCHRLGKKAEGRVRQTVVRFVTRRQRDALYNGRYTLKKEEGYKDVYINEDLTTMRYSVLMAAKESPSVKKVTTKFGNIVCKMTNDETKTISSPDGLFDVGFDDIDYKKFKLHFFE